MIQPPLGSVASTPSSLAAVEAPQFLALADAGVAAAKTYWWDAALGWYDERLTNAWDPSMPLARLWDAFPLFEAVDAVAIADPTVAHLDAVRAFAAKAEQYYNPNLTPVGGYDWYIDTTNPDEHAYFDDNGWWEIGFLDAYRATRDIRFLDDAERAFRFIAVAGWDPSGGGVWWETHHLEKTAEPLAAEIYVGLALYQITGQSTYLQTAQQFLDWANANSWNQQLQLYCRSATDTTVLDYVEGMMIGADLELYDITAEQSYLDQAKQLAQTSLDHFGLFATRTPWPDRTPAVSVIYLRFILDLYVATGEPVWYQVVYDNAERALANDRGAHGLYLRRWSGGRFPAGLLQPHAATVSLFAWLATAAMAPARAAPPDATPLSISVTPSTLVLPATPVGQTSSEPVRVTNTSQSPVTITGVGFGPLARTDTGATFATSNACPLDTPLQPGQSCRVDVVYAPTSAQASTITLTIESTTGQGTNPQAQITVQAPSGSGGAAASAPGQAQPNLLG
jgi:hypothetical protein